MTTKKQDILNIICNAMGAAPADISGIRGLTAGKTNHSYLFTCQGKQYILRIPGEGTAELVNRAQEAATYAALSGRNICDDIAHIDPESGYKISEFFENARGCDPLNPEDVEKCMAQLRAFHEMELSVPHTFDIFEELAYYESLWDGAPPCMRIMRKQRKTFFPCGISFPFMQGKVC